MSKDSSFVAFVVDQLSAIPAVRSRGMFGGHGIYSGNTFFGLVAAGRLYFKTDGSTRQRYINAGMAPFAPKPDQVLKNYYEVPVDVIEDDGRLSEWAREAIEVATP